MKSFLVLGLGRFGRHLAGKLMDLGNEVMVCLLYTSPSPRDRG